MAYQTEQKKMLSEFLAANGDQGFTIGEILSGLSKEYAESALPGKSTVYRLVQQLVENGRVRRFAKDNGRSFVYQSVCNTGNAHLHLRCEVCDKLLHMDVPASENLRTKILEAYQFEVDRAQAVLVGVCGNCRK